MSRDTWTPADGPVAALEMLDGPAEVTEDAVPSLDQDVPVSSYRDWRKEDTRVISCRIGNDLYLKDERFESRGEALHAIRARYGRVLEEQYVPGRAFFRVFRQGRPS